MIRSLVWQLSVNNVTAPQPLRSLYAACLNGQRQPTTDSLLDTLRDLLQGYDRVFLVLDALDECTDRSELLSAVTKISAWQLGIRILVTSRIETEIGEYLNRIGKEKIGIQSALVDSDIRAYVQERLSNDWKLRRWKNHSEIRNEIENTLTENAGGITLDETYARILRNVDDAWSPSVARILEWLVFSATPLHLAEVAELVAIDINEDPPFDPSRRLPEPKDILTMCSTLHRAARDGYEALAAKLVRNGADVNARTDTGETPLHMAVERGSLKIAKLLLGYGAEIEAQDNVGKVPLYDAVVNKDQKMVELLLDRGGADIEVKDHLGRTIIFIAIETGALDIIHVILDRVPNLQNTDIQGQSLIHYAARSGLITVVERLLSDIRREDDYGRTALHVACDAGHSQVVHLLLSQGANIEARTSSGQTPLFYAAIPGHVSIVEQLLDRGANMKARDDYGGSVLYTAAAAGEEAEAVVDLLIDRIETKTKSESQEKSQKRGYKSTTLQ
ncbi:ankyrin repeat-containing domain protein [Halenospora varia]|nr:ankyrin repeat-containing domain protein [Halenospora varia]